MAFEDLKVSEYLSLVGSKTSTPGGGSVLGLVLSLACSLDLMVVNFTLSKKGYENVQEEVISLKEEIIKINHEAQELMNLDSVKFNELMDAYRSKDDERIACASIGAADVPYKLYKLTKSLEEISSRLCVIGNKNVTSDSSIARDLCVSIYQGCVENIKANIKAIKDEEVLTRLTSVF